MAFALHHAGQAVHLAGHGVGQGLDKHERRPLDTLPDRLNDDPVIQRVVQVVPVVLLHHHVEIDDELLRGVSLAGWRVRRPRP